MHLTVREAAHVLRIPENHVYRMIEDGQLPCYWVNDQARLNRTELLEWATARRMFVSTELFTDDDDLQHLPSLADALIMGGVHYHVAGTDRESVLRAVVNVLQLPEDVDRETLLQVLLSRESAGSTAIGDGIAIPHVRQPIAVNSGGLASIAVCFLEVPVEFGVKSNNMVHTLFTMVTPTVRRHLQLLAKIAAALHDEKFKASVLARATALEIIKEARRLDEMTLSIGSMHAT
jgi:nitrogen PTS system EIIA component